MNDLIRDRLVVGIADSHIQRKLLSEEILTLDAATKIALSMEAANRNVASMSGHGTTLSSGTGEVNALEQKKTPRCYRCGGFKHLAPDCYFKDK